MVGVEVMFEFQLPWQQNCLGLGKRVHSLLTVQIFVHKKFGYQLAGKKNLIKAEKLGHTQEGYSQFG